MAAARRLGIGLSESAAALGAMKAVFGRVERIRVQNTDLSILLVKNPAGANEVLRTLALEPGPLRLWTALNDRIADGRDISWVWDADFEILADRVETVVCSGTRAPELALRLKYAGWPEDRLVVEPDLERSLTKVLQGEPERVYALPTYTALLDLRTLLSQSYGAGRYWQPS
jgi:UDP-N-acetylmuramyl tripeptide synthase